MSDPTLFEILARLAIAVLCGGIPGWEREWQSKPAGLRTHMLVALGAAGFTVATLTLAISFKQDGAYQLDPLRVVEGVIGGIGFLGAGSIIQSQGSVKGITTAATIWVVGAIGVSCGIGALRVAGIIKPPSRSRFSPHWGISRIDSPPLGKTKTVESGPRRE